MLKFIRADTRMEGWLQAAAHVRGEGEHSAIVLEIANPLLDTVDDERLMDRLDELYAQKTRKKSEVPGNPAMHSINTVAEYIFPAWEYQHHGWDKALQNYVENYPRVRRTNPGFWGTYAYRMMTVELDDKKLALDKEGNPINPLQEIADKMAGDISKEGAKSKATYEINIWRPWRDHGILGLPCLTHLSFKLIDGRINLTALYRSHDYAYKVPGNLLGLSRLMAALAERTGGEVGSLVIHSTRSFFDPSAGALGPFYELLDEEIAAHTAPVNA